MNRITYREALDSLVEFLDNLYFNTDIDHAQLIKCISESFNVVMFNFISSLEENAKENLTNKEYFSNPKYLDLSVEIASLINNYRNKNLEVIEIIYILSNVLKALTASYHDIPAHSTEKAKDADDLFSIDIGKEESLEEDYSNTLNNVIEKFKSL